MTLRLPLPDSLLASRVIAIARGRFTRAQITEIAFALADGGVGGLEITMNSDAAPDLIDALVQSDVRLAIGAGTVLDIADAGLAAQAGVAFLVTPHSDPSIIAWAQDRNIPAIIGALTPTEIQLAWTTGASAIKLFPTVGLGPGYLRELRGPLGHMTFVAMGGITDETVGAHLEAGADIVGVGSWLVDRDPTVARERALRITASIRSQTHRWCVGTG